MFRCMGREQTLQCHGGELMTPTLNRSSQKQDSLHRSTLVSDGWLKLLRLPADVSGKPRDVKLSLLASWSG